MALSCALCRLHSLRECWYGLLVDYVRAAGLTSPAYEHDPELPILKGLFLKDPVASAALGVLKPHLPRIMMACACSLVCPHPSRLGLHPPFGTRGKGTGDRGDGGSARPRVVLVAAPSFVLAPLRALTPTPPLFLHRRVCHRPRSVNRPNRRQLTASLQATNVGGLL